MSAPLEEFYRDLRQEVLAGAEANEDFHLAEFVSIFERELSDAGQIEGLDLCHYRHPSMGMRVDGSWTNDDGGLDLFIADFADREKLETISGTDVTRLFKQLTKFYSQSANKNLYEGLEPSAPVYGLARAIHEHHVEFSRINLYLLSERALSDRFKQVEFNHEISRRPVTVHIWDVSRLHRLQTAAHAREAIEIDLEKLSGSAIPCLPAHGNNAEMPSYLLAIPGILLADLYSRYGARLLEQNVRTFLQARGAVNKGIRETIICSPEMFFAYNNGVTATATNVETKATEKGTVITHIEDLQIVNGGQTTASLFHTRRKDKADLADIFVQMKLSVIPPALSENIVPKISEYANTQNKVSAADFFSNHPFQVQIEQISRRLWAPARQGEQRETKWFYERARGQFADAQSKLTLAEKKKFLAEFPKKQMFTKTDLAKFENAWDEHPRYVNLGAQKNFVQYAKRIEKEWAEDASPFDDGYFRRAVARGILFRDVETIVSSQPWYGGGFRANIVAYTISVFAVLCRDDDLVFDHEAIWKTQSLDQAMRQELALLAQQVNEILMEPPQGMSHVSEWAKKDVCWETMLRQLPKIRRNAGGYSQFTVSL